jgi:hypothetical protein
MNTTRLTVLGMATAMLLGSTLVQAEMADSGIDQSSQVWSMQGVQDGSYTGTPQQVREQQQKRIREQQRLRNGEHAYSGGGQGSGYGRGYESRGGYAGSGPGAGGPGRSGGQGGGGRR